MVKHNNVKYCFVVSLVCIFLIAIIVSNLFPGLIRQQAAAQTTVYAVENPERQNTRPFQQHKILHVMSYHSPWEWTDIQWEGFQAALHDLNIQCRVFQMDMKRNSDETWKEKITGEIIQTIDTWKPDLIFTSDDAAQQYIARKYVNSSIPVVFSAVNAEPEEYGFTGSRNVTGVTERLHFLATLQLLKRLVPDVKTVVLLSDNGQMWPGIIEQFRKRQGMAPDIEVVGYDLSDTYRDFQNKVLKYQTQVDAIGFLGVFEFKDENNENVPQAQVMRWVAENNKLPDFSFWKDRVDKGTLCAVTVSGYDQGYQAGLLAHKILAEGASPSSLPMEPTKRGIPMINLQTAGRLGITPQAEILLTADVVRKTQFE